MIQRSSRVWSSLRFPSSPSTVTVAVPRGVPSGPDGASMDPASLRPAVVHRHHSTRSPSPASSSSGPSNSLSSSRTSTRASTSSLVRPAPARKGQPASSRNFAASSAAGATSHLAHATQHAHARHDDSARTGLNEQQVNKLDHWEASYVSRAIPRQLAQLRSLRGDTGFDRLPRRRRFETITRENMSRQVGGHKTLSGTLKSSRGSQSTLFPVGQPNARRTRWP